MEKKPFHELVAEQLIRKLQEGTAPWQVPWKAGTAVSRLPLNPVTGKRYRGINALHLLAQSRADQRWMTYKQAVAAGAQVRKGERGTPIQYWKFDEQQEAGASSAMRDDPLHAEGKIRVRLERPQVFYATVFNAEQIDGLPEQAANQQATQTWQPDARAQAILSGSGAIINHAAQDQAFYSPTRDAIYMPAPDQFSSAGDYYAVALHELSHWTGHSERLARDLRHPFGSEAYAKEELRAEIASMLLGHELGTGHDPSQHAAYVASWIKVLRDDPMEIFRAAADAEKILGYVLPFELKHQQEVDQVAKMQSALDAGRELVVANQGHLVTQEIFVMLATAESAGQGDSVWTIHVGTFHVGDIRAVDSIDAAIEMHRTLVNAAFLSHVVPMGTTPAALPSHDVMQDYAEIGSRYPELYMPEEVLTALSPRALTSITDAQFHLAIEPGAARVVVQMGGKETVLEGNEQIQRFVASQHLDVDDHALLQSVMAIADRYGAIPDEIRYANRFSLPAAGLGVALIERLQNAGAMSAQDAALANALERVKSGQSLSGEDTILAACFEEAFCIPMPQGWNGQVSMEAPKPASTAWMVSFGYPGPEEGATLSFPDQGAANALMIRVKAIDAHSEPDLHDRQFKLDALLEDTIQQYPDDGETNSMNTGFPGQPAIDRLVAAAFRSSDRRALEESAMAAFGFNLPENWTGEVVAIAVGPDGAEAGDGPADGYQLFAGTSAIETRWEFLKQVATLEAAESLEHRLKVVDLQRQESEHMRAILSARLEEERLRSDPTASDEMKTAAKEFRKAAEARQMDPVRTEAAAVPASWLNMSAEEVAMVYDSLGRGLVAPRAGERILLPSDAPRHLKEAASRIERGEPAGVPLQVAYKDRNEVKELGARWDRAGRIWFVPAWIDPAPFQKWQVSPEPQSLDGKKVEQLATPAMPLKSSGSREYLAVPYEERDAARAAGARWDKAAKSWYVGASSDRTALQRWSLANTPATQEPAMDPREEFAEKMRELGLVADGEHPLMDGKKHRVPVEGGKAGAKDGFYVLYPDGHPAGFIMNNLTGVDVKWKSKGYALSDEQKAVLQAEAAAKLAKRQADQTASHEATAQRVRHQLEGLFPVDRPTPYLEAKQIGVHAGAFTDSERLTTFIPVIDVQNKLWSMQYMQPDGTKRYAKDGRKEGCFHAVGGLAALAKAPVLVIGEGYATAATMCEALGFATVAAFDSGNLRDVAIALHAQFPEKPVVIAGDDDRHLVMTHGRNAGRLKAEEAAAAVGGAVVFPVFAPGEGRYPKELDPVTPEITAAKGETEAQRQALREMKRFTDWNDLAVNSSLGKAAVSRQLSAVIKGRLSAAQPQHSKTRQQSQSEELDLGDKKRHSRGTIRT